MEKSRIELMGREVPRRGNHLCRIDRCTVLSYTVGQRIVAFEDGARAEGLSGLRGAPNLKEAITTKGGGLNTLRITRDGSLLNPCAVVVVRSLSAR
jgi:hypothetical protein